MGSSACNIADNAEQAKGMRLPRWAHCVPWNTACIAYSTSYGQFPAALSSLGPVASGGTASSTSADLIDSVLAAGTKSGYTFVYTAGSSNQSYTITAKPIIAGQTGQRMFFTDQSGVIRADGGECQQHSDRIESLASASQGIS